MPLAPTSPKNRKRRARLVPISISGMPEPIKKKIAARAKAERRSVSFVIVDLLTKAVERAEADGDQQSAA